MNSLGLLASMFVWRLLLTLALLGTLSSTVFLILALAAAVRYRIRAQREKQLIASTSALPPVTILKPVHGAEPRLRENLESFFLQDYPDFEIVFGARDPSNEALKVVEDLQRHYPQVKARIVYSGPPQWPNAKVFSLDKMIATTTNDLLVVSDSDVEVGADFLRNIVPPLLQPENGLLTCLYRGVPASSLWSSLEALGMSVEMTSGVITADMMEGMRFALGAVIALRRDALNKIGGMIAASDYYSDDFVLGNLVWAAGYNVVLSSYIAGHVLMPTSFIRSFGHQLRWTKSTRYSRPLGHLGTGLTFAVPFGLLGWISAVALGRPQFGLALLLAAILNRMIQSLAIGWGVTGDVRALALCWIYPLRDVIGFFAWAGSYFSRTFLWRGELYRFGAGGRITAEHRNARPLTDQA
ncbi:MAG: glycosyl transferase [Acidobacteria bacterium]|jgi:ceramide glucosyltransferase|nr:MAG: glycosyl transferase [Acidobacteriota bacterium]